ncbi:PREDICTED: uncharacterized protein LOC109237216 isoform X2 [Nicotiana attenuata]|uniref:uncharacterized protein LOC109237216 isoform X2 n=1 Tax=Nicotiana attenuata TaxID=49451 RepID=UPI000904B250|nr:PREDICTED: uncharacterized protein LOC109237216 isoform X2 [Nicotiana attenuata]
MAESTKVSAMKRQILKGGGEGFEPPSSSEKKQKFAEGGSVTPLYPEDNEKSICFCDISDDNDDGEKIPNEGGCCLCNPTKPDPDSDEDYPEELRPSLEPILLKYHHQALLTNGFDFAEYPGPVAPISPIVNLDTHKDFGVMMELANLAIQEYNEKECNVFKYKLLKIEKATYMLAAWEQYFMTVKVLNLTLATPIETFQIYGAKRIFSADIKEVLHCGPKRMIGKDSPPEHIEAFKGIRAQLRKYF